MVGTHVYYYFLTSQIVSKTLILLDSHNKKIKNQIKQVSTSVKHKKKTELKKSHKDDDYFNEVCNDHGKKDDDGSKSLMNRADVCKFLILKGAKGLEI